MIFHIIKLINLIYQIENRIILTIFILAILVSILLYKIITVMFLTLIYRYFKVKMTSFYVISKINKFSLIIKEKIIKI